MAAISQRPSRPITLRPHGRRLGRRAGRTTFVLLAFAGTIGLGGCGSDDESTPSASTSSVTAPEDVRADDATVTAGLGRMLTSSTRIAGQVAAGTEVDDAGEQLERDWKGVEGTVKAEEPDLYIRIEDAIGGLDAAGKAGDATKSAKVAADLSSAVADYLAKHP